MPSTGRRAATAPAALLALLALALAVTSSPASAQASRSTRDRGPLGGAPLGRSTPPWPAVEHDARPSDRWGDAEPPLPTNAWWQDLVLGAGGTPTNVLPYAVRATGAGLEVGVPVREVRDRFVVDAFTADLRLGAIEDPGRPTVVHYDPLSVTVAWGADDERLRAPIVRGMAYATVAYAGLAPRIGSQHALLEVDGEGVATGRRVEGTRFRLRLNDGRTWRLYCSSPLAFDADPSGLVATRPFGGTLRVALDPGGEATAVLDRHAGCIPVGGDVSADVEGDRAGLRFSWRTEGGGSLLTMALPHHRDQLDGPVEVSALRAATLHGEMQGVVGDSWILREELTDIGFAPPRAVDPRRRRAVRDALMADRDKAVVARDVYFAGKQMAALARLALIADELGERAAARRLRDRLAAELERWLAPAAAGGGEREGAVLAYDRTWGGVVVRSTVGDRSASFGHGYYNDHHFHYGYLIYAAAALAKGDRGWARTHRRAVEHLVRDIASPSADDPHYPRQRCMDWFAGHSWATGLFETGSGRNQESTSEAVNAWYAVSLWGRAVGDARLRDLGRLMLATEIRAAQRYWQVDSRDGVYPEPFARHKVVGILWQSKVDHATFFGRNLEYIHGIQMLPFTPISEDLLDPAWVAEASDAFAPALDDASPGWRGFLIMARAVLDPDAAWDAAVGLQGFDDGNTRTNTLHWIATRPLAAPRRR